MLVRELIALLAQLPQDALVVARDADGALDEVRGAHFDNWYLDTRQRNKRDFVEVDVWPPPPALDPPTMQ